MTLLLLLGKFRHDFQTYWSDKLERDALTLSTNLLLRLLRQIQWSSLGPTWTLSTLLPSQQLQR